MRARSVALALVSAVVAFSASAQQGRGRPSEHNPVLHQPTDPALRLGDTPRMIVKFRSASPAGRAQIQSAASEAAASAAVTRFAARTGVTVREARALAAGMHALRLEPRAGETFAEQLARVRLDPDVEFAVPDERRFPHAVPNDPLYNGQWYLQSVQPAAVHAETAWDTSVGSSGVVIAVIDTGVLYSHPDLKRADVGGRLLPGYDFIANEADANDGNGRDSDPTDAGDAGCGDDSSWHGTRVSGIIGALANNSQGVAGITWSPQILPARVLGKCGGSDSDILDAMAWAGGAHVNGIPDNPFPAKIENLSLGSTGEPCPSSYQAVVADLTSRGVLVVVSAGNEGGPQDTPANCPGVVGVTGLRHVGTKVGFASLGPDVTIGAPAGNCVNTGAGDPCLFSIDTTTNDGTTSAGNDTYTDQINYNVGTSFSAPIVSGIAGLMVSVNGNLGAGQLRARLQEGATTFPVSTDPTVPMCHVPADQNDVQDVECNCTTDTCGAGMASAVGALNAALRPIAAVVTPGSVAAGQPVALSGAGSAAACKRTISTYAWQVVGGTGSLTSTNTAATSLSAAPTSGSVAVRLTVTDDVGKQDSADVVITSNSASSSAPSNAGNHACPTESAPPPVGVTVAPATANVEAAVGTQAFTATVTNAQNTSVTWQVNGVNGGNATVGTIAATGVYSAPATVPSPATVTVTAVSVQDPTKMVSAQVMITAPPAPPSPSGGGGGGGALDLLGLLCLVALGRRFAPAWLRARRES